jgi:hypothetical protein
MKRILIASFVCLIILGGLLIFFILKCNSLQIKLDQANTVVQAKETNEKILAFTKEFIDKVLKAESEVDFETRLKLENNVRNLNDQDILGQWQRFTESRTESEAQKNVKDFLQLLINKISA